MPSVNLKAPSIGGLRLGMNPRQLDNKIYVVEGRNFINTLEGPQTYFYGRILGYDKLGSDYYQAFSVENETLLFTNGTVLRFDELQGRFGICFVFPDADMPEPWSHAYVGDAHYFARDGVNGIIRYAVATKQWSFMTGGSVPSNPLGIANVGGRLAILTYNLLTWSALDDGQDLTPSLTTGAGFQYLTIAGGGAGIAVKRTGDGCLVYTKTGVMKTELANAPVPFRHYTLPGGAQAVPVNRWCVAVTTADEQIVLTASGMYVYRSNRFEVWDNMFSSFLRNKFFNTRSSILPASPRLNYVASKQLLFVGITEQQNWRVTDYAYVRAMDVEEWGICSRPSRGHFDYSFNIIAPNGLAHCWIDAEGYFRRVTLSGEFTEMPESGVYSETGGTEVDSSWIGNGVGRAFSRINITAYSLVAPNQRFGLWREQLIESAFEILPEPVLPAAIIQDTIEDWLVMPDAVDDWMLRDDERDWLLENALLGSNLILNASQSYLQFTRVEMPSGSPDSDILIGPIRFGTDATLDQVSLVTDLMLTSATLDTQSEIEDWMAMPDQVRDWMTMPDSIDDWLANITPDLSKYQVKVYGTLDDGTTLYGNQIHEVSLRNMQSGSNFYSVFIHGLRHFIFVRVDEPGTIFQLQAMECTGTYIGPLNGGGA